MSCQALYFSRQEPKMTNGIVEKNSDLCISIGLCRACAPGSLAKAAWGFYWLVSTHSFPLLNRVISAVSVQVMLDTRLKIGCFLMRLTFPSLIRNFIFRSQGFKKKHKSDNSAIVEHNFAQGNSIKTNVLLFRDSRLNVILPAGLREASQTSWGKEEEEGVKRGW